VDPASDTGDGLQEVTRRDLDIEITEFPFVSAALPAPEPGNPLFAG